LEQWFRQTEVPESEQCDAVGLDVPTAKESLLDAGRWLVSGALAELTDRHRQSKQT
jgi:hypothetical protein